MQIERVLGEAIVIIVVSNDPPPGKQQHLTTTMAAALDYLGLTPAPPTSHLLDQLVTAYTSQVPWESASRIVRRARRREATGCPRWPQDFWREAIQHGTGGTCFESNYALFWLLRGLGYDAYLTLNDMGEARGCHTAIIVRLGGQRWLVDVGMPLYLPVPLNPAAPTQRRTAHHTYIATPLDSAGHHYMITRDRHPRPDCFTLIDHPVADEVYRAATTADYGADGLFLDRVVINRVVEGVIWRFDGVSAPYHLESFRNGDKTYHLLGHDHRSIVPTVAGRFGMDAALLREALDCTTEAPRV